MSEIIKESIENYALSKTVKKHMDFSKVGIVGCGTTGQKIALMIASRGIEVVFLEVSDEKIAQALHEIEGHLDDKINHWGLTGSEKKLILSRLTGTLNYADFKDCDLVVEAIFSEKKELGKDVRQSIFRNIEEHVSPKAIIASNSTSVSITELSAELKHPERCVSLHFSITAPDAQIIEIVRGLYTDESLCEDVNQFAKLINRIPIPVEESTGLVSVRLGVSLISEACDLLMEGVASKEDIDFVTKKGLGLPLGPFEMADKIGLEKVVRWMDNLYNEFGDKKYKPSPVIKKLVRAKHYGRKTGEGFYKYDEIGNKSK